MVDETLSRMPRWKIRVLDWLARTVGVRIRINGFPLGAAADNGLVCDDESSGPASLDPIVRPLQPPSI